MPFSPTFTVSVVGPQLTKSRLIAAGRIITYCSCGADLKKLKSSKTI